MIGTTGSVSCDRCGGEDRGNDDDLLVTVVLRLLPRCGEGFADGGAVDDARLPFPFLGGGAFFTVAAVGAFGGAFFAFAGGGGGSFFGDGALAFFVATAAAIGRVCFVGTFFLAPRRGGSCASDSDDDDELLLLSSRNWRSTFRSATRSAIDNVLVSTGVGFFEAPLVAAVADVFCCFTFLAFGGIFF